MYFLDVFFFGCGSIHQVVDLERFSDKSRGRRQIYKLMCLAASFVRFANRWNRDGSNPPSLCIQQRWCASEKKSSVPCVDIFAPPFENRQNYWHSRAAKHIKRSCLLRFLSNFLFEEFNTCRLQKWNKKWGSPC